MFRRIGHWHQIVPPLRRRRLTARLLGTLLELPTGCSRTRSWAFSWLEGTEPAGGEARRLRASSAVSAAVADSNLVGRLSR